MPNLAQKSPQSLLEIISISHKVTQKPPQRHPGGASGAVPSKRLQLSPKSPTLGCPWETIGSQLAPLGSRWGTFGSPLTSLVQEKSLKKHLLEYVTLLIHLFIEFGAKSERPNMQSDRARSIQTHVGTFLRCSRISSRSRRF